MDVLTELKAKLRLTLPDCKIDATEIDGHFVLSVYDHENRRIADVEWYADGHSIWWDQTQPIHPDLMVILQAVNEVDIESEA